jgi:multimeric flavodoxin WrbA
MEEHKVNIGIVVYSHTGHTLSVAIKLKEKLSAAGHAVALEQLQTVGPESLSATSAQLNSMPAIDKYDALVFSSPVRGGVPAPPMVSCLERVASLEGRKVACLVTGFFPARWGRDQTVARMKELCASKGATVCGAGSVGWFSLRRKREISKVVDSLASCFESPPAGSISAE